MIALALANSSSILCVLLLFCAWNEFKPKTTTTKNREIKKERRPCSDWGWLLTLRLWLRMGIEGSPFWWSGGSDGDGAGAGAETTCKVLSLWVVICCWWLEEELEVGDEKLRDRYWFRFNGEKKRTTTKRKSRVMERRIGERKSESGMANIEHSKLTRSQRIRRILILNKKKNPALHLCPSRQNL